MQPITQPTAQQQQQHLQPMGTASASLDQALALQTMHVMHDVFSGIGTGYGGGLLKLALMVGIDGLKGAVGAVLAASAAWALRPTTWAGAMAGMRAAVGALCAMISYLRGGRFRSRTKAMTGMTGMTGMRAATHVEFAPHPLFWQHLISRAMQIKVDKEEKDDSVITWAVSETALEQPDLDTMVVRETWTDVHLESRTRSLIAFVEGTLQVELTYRRKGAVPTSISVKPAAAMTCVRWGCRTSWVYCYTASQARANRPRSLPSRRTCTRTYTICTWAACAATTTCACCLST